MFVKIERASRGKQIIQKLNTLRCIRAIELVASEVSERQAPSTNAIMSGQCIIIAKAKPKQNEKNTEEQAMAMTSKELFFIFFRSISRPVSIRRKIIPTSDSRAMSGLVPSGKKPEKKGSPRSNPAAICPTSLGNFSLWKTSPKTKVTRITTKTKSKKSIMPVHPHGK